MERDWCGNNSVFICNGASNHSNNKAENFICLIFLNKMVMM